MRLSLTLSTYIGRQFAVRFGAIFAALTGLVYLLDMIEMLRQTSTRAEVPLSLVLHLSALKLPNLMHELIPFIVLFATMLTFWRLSKGHELTVVRAAGVSVWQFLLPALLVALVIGGLRLAVLNPLGAVMFASFERLESTILHGRTSQLAVSQTGVWLRQADGKTNAVIHALRVGAQEIELHDVIIFNFEGTDQFVSRIDAASARLEPGAWVLRDAWISRPDQPSHFEAVYHLPTEMTSDRIQESFASPETISFWDLPDFIRLMENAGFSATRHRLYWHRLLAGPLLVAAMVMLAATFSLRPPRRGGAPGLIIAGVLSGFLLYFLSNVVAALGLSSSIPVILAAWTPAGVSTLIAITLLLHLEDG